MLTQNARKELLLAGVRWANNILVELGSNHARAVSHDGADQLRVAIAALSEAECHFQKASVKQET